MLENVRKIRNENIYHDEEFFQRNVSLHMVLNF